MKYYISADRMKQDAYALACQIAKSGKHYDGIIVIAKGGLHLSYYLAHMLDIKYIQTLCIKTPHSGVAQHIQYGEIITNPSHVYLVVDDLVDTGHTLEFIHQQYPTLAYDVATLYWKKGAPVALPQGGTYFFHEEIPNTEGIRIDFYYE